MNIYLFATIYFSQYRLFFSAIQARGLHIMDQQTEYTHAPAQPEPAAYPPRADGGLKISILIPCWNEEATIARCVQSCLEQDTPADQILIVNDCSTDRSGEILAGFDSRVTVVTTPQNSGNKSHAQQYGLGFITGDVVITSDADTIIDRAFVTHIKQDFADPKVAAAGGYVKSLKHNWLTACRAVDYAIGQNLHKLAQSHLEYMFVIPGAAGAFRTEVFRSYLTFDHDTITEDLDFTYKLHKHGFQIFYDRNAIVYTQDPATLHSYINQMRRWFSGGWQNLFKHRRIALRPAQALELSLMYLEGLVFAALLLIVPLLSLRLAAYFFAPYLLIALAFSVYAAAKEKRTDVLLAPLPYLFLSYVNAYLFIEQFLKAVFKRKKHLVWFKPERVRL